MKKKEEVKEKPEMGLILAYDGYPIEEGNLVYGELKVSSGVHNNKGIHTSTVEKIVSSEKGTLHKIETLNSIYYVFRAED